MIKDKNQKISFSDMEKAADAYNTLSAWVKDAPKVIDYLMENELEEELKQYKVKVKLILDKLKDIQRFNEDK